MAQENVIPLEILVATMNRNSWDFLDSMFMHNDLDEHHVLVINQTTDDRQLESPSQNIRVINSSEIGLSKSRNLAIDNAMGSICLLADDDVVFLKDFKDSILKAYSELTDADLICFQTKTFKGQPFSHYPDRVSPLNGFYPKVLSIEISFKQDPVKANRLYFDENFGLGSQFEDGENRLFLKSIVDHPVMRSYFVPEFIVQHESVTSSDEVFSDRFIHARSALSYKQQGIFAYFYIFRLLFSLWRKGFIRPSQLLSKFKVAQGGINAYKTMIHA